jgi:hypothetical protein
MRQMMRSVVIVLVLLAGVFGVRADAQMTKYTYIVIVAAPDTKQQFKTLADAIETTFTGQGCTGVGGPDLWCDWFTFNANPTIQADVLLVVNGDVANNLGNQLDRVTAAYKRLTFGAVYPRDELIRRGKILARGDGAAAYLVLQAGDTVPVDVLGAFVPY